MTDSVVFDAFGYKRGENVSAGLLQRAQAGVCHCTLACDCVYGRHARCPKTSPATAAVLGYAASAALRLRCAKIKSAPE